MTIDYDGAMSRHFDASRALSSDSMATWRATFQPYVAGADLVVDVGCGTGRFTVLLSEWFDVAVVGIEPARGMRAVAAATKKLRKVSFVGGRSENLPLCSGSATVALLSNVYHHIRDRYASAQELHRVLHPGGGVLIRGTFGDRLGDITLFDYFPEAKSICSQFPTLEETAATFANIGFKREALKRVRQQTCSTLKELADRTRLRADTTLALMDDEVFASRQAALEQAARAKTKPTRIIETLDLLILRKSSGGKRR